jgi:superfamily II DNA or RNA helicase
MSICINLNTLSKSKKQLIADTLEFYPEVSDRYKTMREPIIPYRIVDDIIYLPYSFAKNNITTLPASLWTGSEELYFNGTLKESQIDVVREASEILKNSGCLNLSLPVGFGKTTISIFLASRFRTKTLVIVHRVVLLNQWNERIKQFCPESTIQILDSKSKWKVDESCDFFIINALNVSKLDNLDVFKFLIVDEAHLISTKSLCQSLQYVTPDYCLSLSATRHRPDNMQILLDAYFGTVCIERTLYRYHEIYKVKTGLKIDMIKNSADGLDWGAILKVQSEDIDRNNLICDILQKHSDRTFLVLSKRITQIKKLYEILQERGEDVCCFYGNDKTHQKSRILLSTTQKVGVGYDNSDLNALILAADIDNGNTEFTDGYYIQFLGRIIGSNRSQDKTPIVFDLVDENFLMLKHWKNRELVYKKHGGIVKMIL